MVSPINTRAELTMLIDEEINAAIKGELCGITLKLNNLVDHQLIDKLYQASNAGVKVKLIVRGVCGLVVGIVGQSENITALSIVDRFLEHPRVAIFNNKGDPKVYISSADWMTRNIDQRVEVGCPIYCPQVKKTIIDIINIQCMDNTKSRILDTEQTNPYQVAASDKPIRSQIETYRYLKHQQMAQLATMLDCAEQPTELFVAQEMSI